MPCAVSGLCRVRYRVRYTPMLHDISPNCVYHGQELFYYINPQAANYNHALKSDADPVDFIKLSGTRNDFEGLFDNEKRLSAFTVSALPTLSGD